jgi:hypothetical protein
MKRLSLLFSLCAICACVTTPQTTDEYRDLFKGGAKPFGGTKQERTVDRSFQSVVGDVRANADRCFNVVTEHHGWDDGHPTYGTFTYHSKTRTTGEGAAEMTVQLAVHAVNEMPPDGYFMMLADFEAVASRRTKVTVYGPDLSSWSDARDSVLLWAGGKAGSCPKLP